MEKRITNGESMNLGSADVYFFDLDGCVYHQDEPVAGAGELLRLLRQDGKRIGVITNNSRQTAAEIEQKLLRMNLRIAADEILTATELTGAYLMERHGRQTVTVIGSESLAHAIRQCGHEVAEAGAHGRTDAVVIGRDTDFTFDKLQRIVDLAGAGARVLAANPDAFHPGGHGRRIPETGALTAAVEAILGQSVDYVGKPGTYMYEYGMRKFDVRPQQCVMVGDNLLTDIAGGSHAGMRTVWVRGAGMNQRIAEEEGGRTGPVPDLVVDQLADLLEAYRGSGNIRN